MTHVTIHAHGTGADSNGPGAFAAIVGLADKQVTLYGGDPCTTAHRMHLTAVIHALRILPQHNVPQGALVSLRSGPSHLTNLLQNGAPDPTSPDHDLYSQLLEAAGSFALAALPEALPRLPDLDAHCAAIAAQQVEPTIAYRLPWCTASMVLDPLPDNLPTPPAPTDGPQTPDANGCPAQATLDELLHLLATADNLAAIRNGAARIAAAATQKRQPRTGRQH